MSTIHLSRYTIVLLALGILALLAAPGMSQSGQPQWDYYPYAAGPPCGCSDPCGGGGGDDSTPCGRPVAKVNLYTGDLMITDLPVYHQQGAGDFPFVMTYSTQSDENSVLGPHWTHSYNMRIVSDMPNGITFKDGNHRPTYFHWDPINEVFYGSRPGACHASQAPDGHGYTDTTIEHPYRPQLPLNFPNQGQTPPARRFQVIMNSGMGGPTPYGVKEMKDSNGLTWTMGYSGNYLSYVQEPINDNSRRTTFTYTSGRLTRVTNPGSQHADFTYDANGRLSTATDALGDTYTYGYSGTDTKIVSIVEPSGRETDFTYTTFRDKPAISAMSVVNSPDSTVEYSYSVQGNGQLYVDVTQTKDGNDRVTRYVYENTDDAANGRVPGLLLNVIQDYGASPHLNLTQAFAYNSSSKLIRYRDSYSPETGGKAHRHFFYYGDANNPDFLTKYIDPENSDANPSDTGLPTANCPGYVFEYDATYHNLTKVTTPESREVDLNYVSGTHRPSSVVVQDLDYNGNQNDHTTSFTWDSGHGYQIASVTDAGSHTTNFVYDDDNWYLDYIDPPLGSNIDVTANSVGDITSVVDGNGNTTSATYDALHRPTVITYPSTGNGTKTVTLDWNCCGLGQVTDENGIITKAEYDPYTKWLTSITEDYGTGHLNYVTEYTYDEVGNCKTVENARHKTTSYTYDNADRPTHVDYPDSTHETWTYRDDGRVITHTDGRGRTTTFRYDADDRIAGPYSGGYKAVDFPNDTDVYLTRNKDGLPTEVRDAQGTSTATYYLSGALKTSVAPVNGTNKTVRYDYNAAGLLSHLTSPSSGTTYDYSYNALNQLSSVTNPNSVQISFSYDNGGRLTTITRPGSYISYQYNARDWLTGVLNRTTGGSTLYDATYYYTDSSLWDYTGNPLKRTESFAGTTYNTTLRYDYVYRLIEETKKDSGNNTVYSETYGVPGQTEGYDAVGNRLIRTVNGTSYTYSYDDNDKLTSASGNGQSASFSYDNNGNMTGVSGTMYGSKTMVYNDSNNLTSLTSAGVTDLYYYNAGGQRYRARLAGTYGNYVYDGDRVLEQWNDSSTLTARYTTAGSSYFAPLLHEWFPSGTRSRFPLFDLTGTARELVDASANVTDTYTLDAFGVKMASDTGSTPNPYHYNAAWGYLTDSSGFQQLGYRFYWPELGRFLQQDPAGDGMNWYAYVGNNPVSFIDPSGLCPLKADKWFGKGNNPWSRRDFHRKKQPGEPDATKKEIEEHERQYKEDGEPDDGHSRRQRRQEHPRNRFVPVVRDALRSAWNWAGNHKVEIGIAVVGTAAVVASGGTAAPAVYAAYAAATASDVVIAVAATATATAPIWAHAR